MYHRDEGQLTSKQGVHPDLCLINAREVAIKHEKER